MYRVLFLINSRLKSVKEHIKDKRNNELMLAYYQGFEAALKDIKKKVNEVYEEQEEIEKISEQDRLNANEYHYENYKNILVALNAGDEAEARAICVKEMNIIDEDSFIENDEEGKIIELPTNHD